MTKEESTKIVHFMTPGIGVLVTERGRIVKMQYFFSSSCQYTWAWIRQIKYLYW